MKKSIFKKPYIWGFTTYFAEGFPFTIIRTVSSVFFRDMKMSLEGIGLTSLFGLPWIIKFLWGPFVDQFSTKKRWLVACQLILTFIVSLVAILSPWEQGIFFISILLFLGSFVAATNDIAIDAYYMEALDKVEQTKYVGYRVLAYRLALMTGTGVIVTIGAAVSWSLAFTVAAIILGLLSLYHLFLLPTSKGAGETRSFTQVLKIIFKWKFFFGIILLALIVVLTKAFVDSEALAILKEEHAFLKAVNFPNIITAILLIALISVFFLRNKIKNRILKDPDSFYAKSFLAFMEKEGVGIILAFVIFMRMGEIMLSSMAAPFMVDLGLKIHYGWMSSTVGLPCSIVGAMAGGYLISKLGFTRCIWPFILLQNVTNLIYMGLAIGLSSYVTSNTGALEPIFIGAKNLALVASVHGFDQFSGGLGSAILTVFLMRICSDEFRASHYAIGSGLMTLSGIFTGVSSGYIASNLGYSWVFGLSFLASVPGMLLIFWLPRRYMK